VLPTAREWTINKDARAIRIQGEHGMANQPTTAIIAAPTLPAKQVYAMAAIYLVVGLGIGYLFRAAQAPASSTQSPAIASAVGAVPGTQQRPGAQAQPGAGQRSPHMGAMAGAGRMPSMEEMQQMAAKKAAPLLNQLKKDPNNSAILAKVGAIYYSTHQFKDAAAYYGKSLHTDPKNVGVRTMLAISLYSDSDVEGALTQLNQALNCDPKDANALFDLGMIRLQAKKDPKGAVTAWRQLLKSNPQLSADRKTEVQKLIAGVQTSSSAQHATEGEPGNAGHKTNSN
jgi:cytochrome c-type biogenesis protein CcmH/NrfG